MSMTDTPTSRAAVFTLEHLDNKRVLLPCLWAFQCTFKGAKRPNLGRWERNLQMEIIAATDAVETKLKIKFSYVFSRKSRARRSVIQILYQYNIL